MKKTFLVRCTILSLLLILGFQLNCQPQRKHSLLENKGLLTNWVKSSPDTRQAFEKMPFAEKTLPAELVKDFQLILYESRKKDLFDQLKTSWENEVFSYQGHQMRIKKKSFGETEAGKSSLYISLHGGGGAPTSVNDQQWKNQAVLYEPNEGLYIAPRAPTDSWNLWHQAHIDPLIDQIIQAAVIFGGVAENKIYLTGYSAGGDGTYQLAPRMADRFAAAAMMAGHPNETTPDGLRNLPFSIYMGALDAAYDRNKIALQWKAKLEKLQKDDPKGYPHKVVVVEGKGHWMDRADTAAINWMATFERRTHPDRVVWKQDDVHQDQFYWLSIPKALAKTGQVISANYSNNTFNIEKNYSDTLYIGMCDEMFDANKPVIIRYEEKVLYQGYPERKLNNIYNNLQRRFDLQYAYPIRFALINNRKVVLNP